MMTTEMAKLEVRDAGRGMTPEEKAKAFDPFFTTRQAISGTGLGLSVSLGMTSDHAGTIDVESELGQGSVVTVSLPLFGPSEV